MNPETHIPPNPSPRDFELAGASSRHDRNERGPTTVHSPSENEPRGQAPAADINELLGFLRGLEIQPSYAVANVLNLMDRDIAEIKDGQISGPLCAGNLFLAFLSVGFGDRGTPYATKSLPLSLITAQHVDEQKLKKIKGQYFAARVEANRDFPERTPPHAEMLEIWQQASFIRRHCSPTDQWLAARHLLAGMIASWTNLNMRDLEKAGFDAPVAMRILKEHLSYYRDRDDERRWHEVISSWPIVRNITRYQAPAIGREARQDELVFDIDGVSLAIARTISFAADGDFCMALKGQWGRGKTTLVGEVAKHLRRNNYNVVYFNVWKYPQRPQVWVHLYQRIFDAASELSDPWRKVRLIFHQSLEAVGWSPLFLALIAFQLAILPAFEIGSWIAKSLGLMALVFLIIFVKNAGKFFRSIRLRYFTATDHTDQLGLQATIGKDLKNLLKVWVRMEGQRRPSRWCSSGVTALIFFMSATVFYRTLHHWPIDFAVWKFAPGFNLWVFATLPAVIFPWLLRVPPSGPRRVLLIVDDLDRCPSESMIHIIESIRLLLDDPEVNKRLQTVIVFDESLLTDALAMKYAATLRKLGQREKNEIFDAKVQRLVRGQLDKYFLLELSLPPLTPPEIQEYLTKLLDWNADVELPHSALPSEENSRAALSTKVDAGRGKASSEFPAGSAKEVKPAENSLRTADVGLGAFPLNPMLRFTFDDTERGAIRGIFSCLSEGAASPRNMRSFLMRCQLGKFLLQSGGKDFDSVILIKAVAARYFGTEEPLARGVEASVAMHVV